jgi:hypothetical protein
MHGYSSYADFVLQHSLLGSAGAAAAFCHQLAAELQPGAFAAVSQLQQQEQTAQQQQHEALSGSDLPYMLHQVCLQRQAVGVRTAAAAIAAVAASAAWQSSPSCLSRGASVWLVCNCPNSICHTSHLSAKQHMVAGSTTTANPTEYTAQS